MPDCEKVKEQLVAEIIAARQRIAALEKIESECKRAEEALHNSNRALKAFKESGKTLVRARNETSYIDGICKILVETCGYVMAWVGFAEPDEKKTVRPVGVRGADDGYLNTITVTWDESETGLGPTGVAIRTRQIQVARFIAADPKMIPWRKAAQERNYHSSIAFPLCEGEVCLGALTIYAREPDAFDAEEVELLSELAEDLVFGIISLRRKEELGRAHELLEMRVRERTAELTQTLESLRIAKELAESATRSRSEFLANMSHELRTPMNGVLGMLQIIKGTHLDAEQRECVDVAMTSASGLLNLINDILDFTKIEAGKIDIVESVFILSELCRSLPGIFKTQIDADRLRFGIDIAPEVPTVIRADASRMRQVLLNLVGNAIKFTEKGEVRVRVEAGEKAGRDAMRLCFSVSDTGIGIPEDQLANIFNVFTQVDSATTRKFPGAGLGLSIVKRLIELMGGDVRILSTLGQGTTVRFEIPVKVVAGEAPPVGEMCSTGVPRSQAQTAQLNLKILLVEDDRVSQAMAQHYLEKAGATVTCVVNGQEALQALATGEKFDCILMDVQMPVMDGVTATRRIREGGGENKNIQIIAITAHAMVGDREKFLEAGMDDYIAKPVDLRVLKDVIRKVLGKGRAHEASAPTANGA